MFLQLRDSYLLLPAEEKFHPILTDQVQFWPDREFSAVHSVSQPGISAPHLKNISVKNISPAQSKNISLLIRNYLHNKTAFQEKLSAAAVNE